MSGVKWTDDQLHAIESRGGALLVSAAAGSGKTAVIVERIIRRIEDEGRDITEFLIITYTKAAASELRRKIVAALHDRIAEMSASRHLRRQLALVPSARISTVHSFCSWILKNYGTRPELAGGFRVLDEADGRVLLDELLEELIDEKYSEGSAEFLALSEHMSSSRGDAPLVLAVRELFERSMSHPYPRRWLESAARDYAIAPGSDVGSTRWGAYIKAGADLRLDAAVRSMELLIADVSRSPEASGIYLEFLSGELEAIRSARCRDWDDMREYLLDIEFSRLPSSRALEDKSIASRVKSVRAGVKNTVADILKVMPESSAALVAELRSLSAHAAELCSLASELGERFLKEKLRRGVLDYADLEHLAIELLVEDYDEEKDRVIPSGTASEIGKNFCELLLDEFQDSNNVQDIIFRAVSSEEKNIIMVGDVKQSIYRFRLADPSIFMKKYKSFKPYAEAREGEARLVTLSKNFRSRGEVIDAANALFSDIMSERLGGMDYTERERLVPRDEIPPADGRDMETELVLIDCSGESDENVEAAEAEAEYVAARIKELVADGFMIDEKDGSRRRVEYGDFAVLLRSAAGSAAHYERALAARGVPYVSPRTEGLLATVEVSSIISLLSVIDNPLSDIPLLSALRSPLFGFSADDLCRIRREAEGELIAGVRSLSQKTCETAEKCKRFLELITELSARAAGTSTDVLIWDIYRKTNALGMFGAMKNGRARQKNLIELYKCARSFEASGYRGLYKFISHIARIAERGGDIPAPAQNGSDAVKLMTIHKSKGLEFPIVFLPGSIRNFNLDDVRRPVLIHPELGIGMRYRDAAGAYECPTVARDAVARAIVDETRSEEMRILYVAMTRAREKLIMVASHGNAARMIAKISEENPYRELMGDALAGRVGTLMWIMLPVLASASGAPLYEYAGIPAPELGPARAIRVSVVPGARDAYAAPSEEIREDVAQEDAELLRARFSFVYPARAAQDAPSKVTATELSDMKRGAAPSRRRSARPRFMRERELTPAERGVAIHMAMQFSDFAKCSDIGGARAELARLLEEKYLTRLQYEAVDAEKLLAFARSETGQRMLRAQRVMREFKFSVLLPAEEVLGKPELLGEEVLLQGVIDMYFEDADGITIVDFKSDAARPTGQTLEKYREQLLIYRRALYEMTGKRAACLVLYLASLGEELRL